MADYQPVVPVKVRTARKQRDCDDCPWPIEPGERYQVHSAPPWRDDNETPRWQSWRSHYPRRGPNGEHLIGCDEAAAYREKAAREQVTP